MLYEKGTLSWFMESFDHHILMTIISNAILRHLQLLWRQSVMLNVLPKSAHISNGEGLFQLGKCVIDYASSLCPTYHYMEVMCASWHSKSLAPARMFVQKLFRANNNQRSGSLTIFGQTTPTTFRWKVSGLFLHHKRCVCSSKTRAFSVEHFRSTIKTNQKSPKIFIENGQATGIDGA